MAADQDALDKAINDHAEPEPGAMLTGWVLVAEWVTLDGTKRLTRLRSAPITPWAVSGLLHDALYGGGWEDGG